jgi:hypothetical protein
VRRERCRASIEGAPLSAHQGGLVERPSGARTTPCLRLYAPSKPAEGVAQVANGVPTVPPRPGTPGGRTGTCGGLGSAAAPVGPGARCPARARGLVRGLLRPSESACSRNLRPAPAHDRLVTVGASLSESALGERSLCSCRRLGLVHGLLSESACSPARVTGHADRPRDRRLLTGVPVTRSSEPRARSESAPFAPFDADPRDQRDQRACAL